jgi:(E)-4-hydroxy-3-methylbut-2-enyl-diphosphate synthase
MNPVPIKKTPKEIDPLVAMRRPSVKVVAKGSVFLGGNFPVSIQSMTNTPTEDIEATVAQIEELTAAGCEIIRVAVPTMKAARAIAHIKERISIPLISDIHFNHRLALAALDSGTDGLRLNPGNIGKITNVKEVARKCLELGISIRIGINGGSLEKDIEKKYGRATGRAMVESALNHIRILEELGFHDIIISLKSSSVPETLEAYRLMAQTRSYPLHLGVTEAGIGREGRTKSFLGIGLLLLNGIGETIRISLTGDPVKEVLAARELLERTRTFVPFAGKYMW